MWLLAFTTNFRFQNCLFMSPESVGILKKYQINITKTRVLILDAFIRAQRSLDQQYFLHQHGHKFERSTVFRTLRLFMDKKIIYRVSSDGNQKYLFQQSDTRSSLQLQHSSFVCISCGKAIPVNTIAIPELKIPKGFTKQDIEIIIRGICPTCKA
jgi:Fur family ferric uptake transcriptional regulator